MTDEFSTDNGSNPRLHALSRMLQDTRQQIDKNLTLDDDASALSRLKRELLTTIEGLVQSNTDFQADVRTTLASMQAQAKRRGGDDEAGGGGGGRWW